MRKVIIYSLLILFSSSILAADLKITINNIHSKKGDIRIAVFSKDNITQFPNGKGSLIIDKTTNKKVYGIVRPAQIGSIHFTVSTSAGIYAVAAFHDDNQDQKLNTMFLLGVPLEPYGFSNDARSLFSSPDFTQAQFKLPVSGADITFDLMGHSEN